MKESGWMKWLTWWATNQFDFETLEWNVKFRESLDELPFRASRSEEYLIFAKNAFELANAGFKAATERTDKLLGIVLIVTGWLITSPRPTTTFILAPVMWVFCVALLVLSVITLLLGRWKIEGRGPAEFATFVNDGNKRPEDETKEWQFEQARQFALAAHETQNETQLVQIRLLVSIILLISGLTLFALRGV